MTWDDWQAPEGWTLSPLTEVADVVMGQSPPGNTYNSEGRGLPFFQGKAEFGPDHPTVRKWCTAPTRIAESGDILMSVRAPVGPTNVADQQCAIGRGLAAIRPRKDVPAGLVRHLIKLQEDEIASWGTGTTFTAINKQHFKDIRVPLPPIRQRQLLADLLDHFIQAQRRSTSHLTTAQRAIDRIRQAVLAAACSGRLTADWREGHPNTPSVERALASLAPSKKRRGSNEQPVDLDLPDLPETYFVGALGDAATLLDYGTSKRCDAAVGQGVPVLRMGNIQDGQLDLQGPKYCLPDGEIERLMLEDGDLLFNRTNSPELVGKSAVFHGSEPMSFASYLIRVRFAPDVALPDFVNYWINSAWGRAWARLAKTDGVSQSNINGSKLALMPLPLPPIKEQRVIVERASQMLRTADQIAQSIEKAGKRVERSSQAVLAKAFRGELVSSHLTVSKTGVANGLR